MHITKELCTTVITVGVHCPQYHGINDNGVEGIQAEPENNNVKIEFGLTKIVSFSVADLACAHNVNVRKYQKISSYFLTIALWVQFVNNLNCKCNHEKISQS